MHNFTTFCDSNENILWPLRWDAMTLINRWQQTADNGYGLCENWGNITQWTLDSFDSFCQWLPKSFVTKAAAYTVMAALMGAWMAWQLADVAIIWWQAHQVTSHCLTLLQGGVVASVCAGAALCIAVGGIIGVSCLVWRWVKPRIKAGLLGCGPAGEVFVNWLF